MRLSRKLLLALALGLLLALPRHGVLAEEEEDEEEEAAGSADEDPDVIVGTDKNFDEVVGKAKFALVEFYAPWCGHCKSLKPQYAKAATILKASDPAIKLVKVDATEEKELGGKYEVQGYPTLKWFVDGKMAMDYSGGRQADDIVRWVKKKTGPPTTEVDSPDALTEAAGDSKVYVLGFFDKYEGDEHAAYEAAALKSEDAAFLKTTDAATAKALNLEKGGSIALARNYDDFGLEVVPAAGHAAFEGEGELEDQLGEFVKAEKLPAYLEFSGATSNDIFGSGINHQVIVVAPPEQLGKGAPLTDAMVAASKATKGKALFVSSKLGGDDGKPIMSFFGLEEEATKPQIVGFFTQGGKKYKFEGEPTAEALEKFALAVVDGTAPKTFKSAAEPKEPKEKGVAVIVGNTVDTIVKDPKKDVLLEVYAPWCGHCKQLAPIYEKLAKRFAKVDSVVIAKMDGTENEHPDIEAQGYPTILFFPAEEGAEPVTYEGERNLKGFVKFLKEHAKVKFELPKKGKKGKKAEKEDEAAHDEL